MQSSCSIVLARFLQTSSTPAWTLWISVFNVSKGVRLGCENLYGGTGGVCMEIWESRRLTFWELRNLEFWKSIDAYVCREIWDPATSKEINILKIKIRVAQNVRKVWIIQHMHIDIMPLTFFCKPLQASGRKMGERCNSFVFCYLTALGHDALILASRSMQGQENRRTMQHFRFCYLTVVGAFAAIHPYIRALFNSCRPLPAFLKFLCLVAIR